MKEFKKAKHHHNLGTGFVKMSYFKEIDKILISEERNRNTKVLMDILFLTNLIKKEEDCDSKK